MNKAILLAAVSSVALMGQAAAQIDVPADLPEYQNTSGVSGNVKSMGSDSLNNLMTLWAEGFRARYPNVQIEIEGKGSSTGPVALIAGTAQFAPMSRAMNSKERDNFEKKYGYQPTQMRVGIDTLAVYVHKDNPIKCLSLQQVDAIFSKTRRGGHNEDITNWTQVGVEGDWKGQPIAIYGRNSASGTYGYFKSVALFDGDYKDSVREQPGSSTVVQGVASDRLGIGYSGIGYMTADVRAVPLASRTGGDCYDATPANAYSGNYPLARFMYVYVNKNPNEPLDPLRAELARWMMSKQGQEATVKDGYIPIPGAIAKEDLKNLGLMK